MATILLLTMVTVFYTALGRTTVPRDQRIPWMAMTLRDVATAVVAGFHELNRLHAQRWGSASPPPDDRMR